MKVDILDQAAEDLIEGFHFYEDRFCKELCVNGFSFWFLFSVVVISRASRSELERAGGRAASP